MLFYKMGKQNQNINKNLTKKTCQKTQPSTFLSGTKIDNFPSKSQKLGQCSVLTEKPI